MSKRNNNNKRNNNKSGRQRRRRNRRRRQPPAPTYASMVADPCNCQLIPGLYGDQEGMMARVKKTLFNQTTGSAGYILWIPEYSNNGEADTKRGDIYSGGNLFTWSTNNPSQEPYNYSSATDGKEAYGEITEQLQILSSAGGQFRLATTNSSATACIDPAFPFVSSDIVQDARTLGACIDIKYTGQLYNSSGEICGITDLPLDALIAGGSSLSCASVDQLFQYSTDTKRLGVDKMEVVARLSDAAEHFKTQFDAPLACASEQDQSVDKSTTQPTDIARTQQPTVFGFAWRGLDLDTRKANLVFNLYKNIEWRPKPISGITHATPIATSAQSQLKNTLSWLDRFRSGWNSLTSDQVGYVAKAAFAGYNVLRARRNVPSWHRTIQHNGL